MHFSSQCSVMLSDCCEWLWPCTTVGMCHKLNRKADSSWFFSQSRCALSSYDSISVSNFFFTFLCCVLRLVQRKCKWRSLHLHLDKCKLVESYQLKFTLVSLKYSDPATKYFYNKNNHCTFLVLKGSFCVTELHTHFWLWELPEWTEQCGSEASLYQIDKLVNGAY